MVRASSITMVGIVGCALAEDEKVGCFFCLFVMFWNYKVCDNGNAMKQYYYQNNYGVIACRKICTCEPIINFFVDPQNFSTGANLYQQLRFFAIFAAVGTHF